jgi:hypothetical protein
MPSLSELAASLAPLDAELRIKDDRHVIAIAGSVGVVVSDLEMRLTLSRLSERAKFAAIELVDSGVATVGDDGRVWIARLPVGGERALLRTALGLTSRRDHR